MGVSLKPEHLRRYKDVALLLFKYGRRDLVSAPGCRSCCREEPSATGEPPAEARELAADVEKLGPDLHQARAAALDARRTSSRRPTPRRSRACRTTCEPFPFEEVEAILERGARRAAGQARSRHRPQAARRRVDRAGASRALRDGREVAVKVQRPGIREQVLPDLEALGDIAALLDEHTDFGKPLRHRAAVRGVPQVAAARARFPPGGDAPADDLGTTCADIPEIVVPQPILGYTTARVLTMEFVAGTKVTALSAHRAPRARRREADRRAVPRLPQADPARRPVPRRPAPRQRVHGATGRIALIDLGMVARVTPGLQERLLQLLLAVSDNQPDEAAKVLLAVGECREGADQKALPPRASRTCVAQHNEMSFQQPQVGRAVLMLLKVAGENRIRLPPELAMIGKTLLNLDEIAHVLAPHFDPERRDPPPRGRDHAAEDGARRVDGVALQRGGRAEELRAADAEPREPHPRPAGRQRVQVEVDAHRRSDPDGRHAEGREPHRARPGARRADRRRGAPDGRADVLRALRLPGPRDPAVHRRGGRRRRARREHSRDRHPFPKRKSP